MPANLRLMPAAGDVRYGESPGPPTMASSGRQRTFVRNGYGRYSLLCTDKRVIGVKAKYGSRENDRLLLAARLFALREVLTQLLS